MFDSGDYIVEVSKLKDGISKFDIKVNKSLFDEFDCQDVLDVKADVKVSVMKQEGLIEFSFSIKGMILTECSRCLAPVKVNISKTTSLYVKVLSSQMDDSSTEQQSKEHISDVWTIKENDNEIDLSNYVYEELRVEIPIAPVHKDLSDCDKQMIDKFSAINDENMKQRQGEIDPRWEKLLLIKQQGDFS